jgi:glycosyltransferase 2 family protein
VAVVGAERMAEPAVVERPSRRMKLSTLVKLAVAVGLMAVILWRSGLEALLQTFAAADWRWVALAVGSASLAMVINVVRWQLMLRGQEADPPLGSLVRLYLVAMFFNNVMPSRLGGDLVRAYGTSLMATTKTRSAAAVLMDRLIGAISVLVLGLAAITLKESRLPPIYQQMIVGCSVISLLALGLMLYRNHRLVALRVRVLAMLDVSLFGIKIGPRLQAALDALRSYSRRRGVIVKAFVISLVANGFSMINLFLYAQAVRADVSLGDVATIAPFILAIGVLPISINGIGTIEAAMVVLFGALGVPQSLALAIAILRRLSLLLLSLVGGVLYATRRFT